MQEPPCTVHNVFMHPPCNEFPECCCSEECNDNEYYFQCCRNIHAQEYTFSGRFGGSTWELFHSLGWWSAEYRGLSIGTVNLVNKEIGVAQLFYSFYNFVHVFVFHIGYFNPDDSFGCECCMRNKANSFEFSPVV